MTTSDALTPRVATPLPTRTLDRVYIVGFAPSWVETPWEDTAAEKWGLNALHRVAVGRPFTRWFQLHSLETEGVDQEHIKWMHTCGLPIYVWPEHMARYSSIPTLVPYPKEWIINTFGTYFTNSISWMLALAIAEGFKQLGIYGVDMAMDGITQGQAEYSWQRPSCEFFLGWAKGAGCDIYIPPTSDLLKTTHLYGAQSGAAFRKKLEVRLADLNQRKAAHENEARQHEQAVQQLAGAIENLTYLIRAWTSPIPTAGVPEWQADK